MRALDHILGLECSHITETIFMNTPVYYCGNILAGGSFARAVYRTKDEVTLRRCQKCSHWKGESLE